MGKDFCKPPKIISIFLYFFLSTASFAAIPSPCEDNILEVFRRPTILTSACTTPNGKYALESGLQYLEYTNKSEGLIFPQAKGRIGLPWRNELTIVFPTELTNNKKAAGLSFTELQFKHDLYYNEHWNTALRATYLPTSGSKKYGVDHNGYILNGILAYRYQTFNASFMLGYSSLSTAQAQGGNRYTTISPDAVLGWQAKNWLQLYAEVYGQFNTGPRQGPGYNMDTGLLFLITKDIAADIEIGHRLSGKLGNFKVYYGTGISFLF